MKRCCFPENFFASNVGVLPVVLDGCQAVDSGLVLSVPRLDLLGHRARRALRRQLKQHARHTRVA